MTSDQEFGIGQVGLGSITVAHRQGYRLYSQPVVAGYDPNPEARERFAEEEPGATVHETLEALLADPRVEELDWRPVGSGDPVLRERRSILLHTQLDGVDAWALAPGSSEAVV